MSTYEQPQFAAPDDTPPTLDTRHRSTLGRVRNRAKAVPREYVGKGSRDHRNQPFVHPNTVYRVDGIGPKSKPPTYGRPVFDEDEQTSSARMLGGVLIALAVVLLIAAIWALGYALDAPAHLVKR